MNKNLYSITIGLCSMAFPNINSQVPIKRYFSLLNKLIKNHGLIHAIKILKTMRLHITRFICGKPLMTNDLLISIDKDGWPKRLDFLKEFALSSRIEDKKFLLTIINLSRSLKLTSLKEKQKLIPDYESITKPSEMRKIIPSGFINKFVKKFNLVGGEIEFLKPHLSTKAGPSGPSTLTSQNNLVYFDYPNLQRLYNLTCKEGWDFLDQQYNLSWNNWMKTDNPNPKDRNIGRLSFIFDPECKLRIVAIVDYYTQLMLRPIHDRLMTLVKNLPCDRTYTQDPRNNWIENSESFWSIDLSSATDRFPISLQRRLIERIYSNRELATAWSGILSNRKFLTPNGDHVSYNTGQPMGSYSSWIAFTLSHHLLVHWCAHLNGIDNFNQYIMLGDDIVIKHDAIAKTYIRWCDYLGVKTSPTKTHVSKDTYEFAKRWYIGSKEITGISMNGIVWNIQNPFIVMSYLYDYFKVKNNLYLFTGNLSDLIRRLYSIIKIRNSKNNIIFVSSKVYKRLNSFTTSLDITFSYGSYDSLRENIVSHIKNELFQVPQSPELIHAVMHEILSKGLTDMLITNIEQIRNIQDEIKNNLSKIGLDDINDIKDYAIFMAINNYVLSLRDKVLKWGENRTPVHESVKELVTLDLNQIFSKERNKVQSLMKIGEVYLKGIKLIDQTDEIYYGSATIESTYSFTDDLLKHVPSCFDKTIKTLEKISQGSYTEPMRKSKETVPYTNIDSYLAFFD